MHDFDIIRLERVNADRRVKLGGEILTLKPSISADVLAAWWDADHETETGAVAAVDAFVLELLEPGQEDAWKRARYNTELPITIGDLRALVNYSIGMLSGRPTERPLDSSGTSSEAGTELTVVSSSQGGKG